METGAHHYRVGSARCPILCRLGLTIDRLLIAFFLSNLDVTIVSSALTSITDDLKGFEKRSWIITGYLATYTGMIEECDSMVYPPTLSSSPCKIMYFEIASHCLYLFFITDHSIISGTMAIWTKVSDIVGRKQTTIAALVILLAFSIGCGCAQTVNQLYV